MGIHYGDFLWGFLMPISYGEIKWGFSTVLCKPMTSHASSGQPRPVHSDAFFRSQRDINRHGSWLDFWKIQVNLVNFISGTFGTAWDKYSKNGLTFGWCLREKKRLKFWPRNYFFQAKTGFWNFYINIYEFLKPDLKNLMSGLSESVKKCTKS